MRVVAGKYKGFKLYSPKAKNSRPTDNKVKESVFDMLYPLKTNFSVLDLFSCTGQMGIEFLSRQASEVVFNEKNNSNFLMLKKNLEKIGDKDSTIFKKDFRSCLKILGSNKYKFDYIYLDPPYETDFIDKALFYIKEYDLSNEDGIIVTESSKDLDFSEKYGLHVYKKKSYGRKFIKIYKK